MGPTTYYPFNNKNYISDKNSHNELSPAVSASIIQFNFNAVSDLCSQFNNCNFEST